MLRTNILETIRKAHSTMHWFDTLEIIAGAHGGKTNMCPNIYNV
jgi:hypothetical protein